MVARRQKEKKEKKEKEKEKERNEWKGDGDRKADEERDVTHRTRMRRLKKLRCRGLRSLIRKKSR